MRLTSFTTYPSRHAFTPTIDGLEDRKLQAAASSIVLSDGVVNFYAASSGSSHAEISPSATTPGNLVASIDGITKEFAAADVKLVWFWDNHGDGNDSFVNNTSKTSISFLAGPGNSVVGGFGADIVMDYSNSANIDDQDSGLVYIPANDAYQGVVHDVQIRETRSGSLIISAR